MNKGAGVLIGILASLFLFSPVVAQDVIVHQVDFPQGDATWSVAAQGQETVPPPPNASASPAPKALKKFVGMDIVCQGKLRRDTITWSDGSTDQMWWIRNLPYVMTEKGGQVGCTKASDLWQVRFDASSFEWVSAKTYLGKKSYQGSDCQYYEMKIVDPDGGPTRIFRAWVDHSSHLPLAFDNGFITVSFTFPKGGPIAPLQMPANFQEMYARLLDFYAHVKQPGN